MKKEGDTIASLSNGFAHYIRTMVPGVFIARTQEIQGEVVKDTIQPCKLINKNNHHCLYYKSRKGYNSRVHRKF